MLNLLLALALTSSISGNDIDIPTPLNTQVETTVDDSTNADIVSAINETNELLETILAPQTITVSNEYSPSFERCFLNGDNFYRTIWYFPLSKGHDYCFTLSFSDQWNSCYVVSSVEELNSSTILSDFGYSSSSPMIINYHCDADNLYFIYSRYNSSTQPTNKLTSSSVYDTYTYQQTYSFSDIGDRLVAQERQLDNITFVVIVLLLLPIIKGITNKLTHRKENS